MCQFSTLYPGLVYFPSMDVGHIKILAMVGNKEKGGGKNKITKGFDLEAIF